MEHNRVKEALSIHTGGGGGARTVPGLHGAVPLFSHHYLIITSSPTALLGLYYTEEKNMSHIRT